METLHGFEIPFTMDIPEGIVGADKVIPTDKAMADLVSASVPIARTGPLRSGHQPDPAQGPVAESEKVQSRISGATARVIAIT